MSAIHSKLLAHNSLEGQPQRDHILFSKEHLLFLENELLFFQEMLIKSLKTLYEQLTSKKKEIFMESYKILEYETYSLNQLAECIKNRCQYSFSTTKWNITQLRHVGLLRSAINGDRNRSTIQRTEMGEVLFEVLINNDL